MRGFMRIHPLLIAAAALAAGQAFQTVWERRP